MSPLAIRLVSASGRRDAALPARTLVVFLTMLCTSCAHYGGRVLELRRGASGFFRQRAAEELLVAVNDLSSSLDSLKFFDRELVKYGYVPVQVMLELDQGTSATFDLSRHDMRLVLNNGQRLESADPEEIASKVAFSYWRSAFGFPFLIFPGAVVISSVKRANEELQHDYAEKSLDNVRINPNVRSHQGVVFFKIPKDLLDSFDMEDAFVEVKIYKQGNGEQLGNVFDLPVHFQ